jgi:hypothetical protein
MQSLEAAAYLYISQQALIYSFAERRWKQQDNGTGKMGNGYKKVLMRDPCVYCGAKPTGLDHIQPESKNGPNNWQNRAPACRTCDQAKGNQLLLHFLHRQTGTVASIINHVIDTIPLAKFPGCKKEGCVQCARTVKELRFQRAWDLDFLSGED